MAVTAYQTEIENRVRRAFGGGKRTGSTVTTAPLAVIATALTTDNETQAETQLLDQIEVTLEKSESIQYGLG